MGFADGKSSNFFDILKLPGGQRNSYLYHFDANLEIFDTKLALKRKRNVMR
jgi:hypothetical protein